MPQLKLRQDLVRTVPYRGTGGKGQCVYWDEGPESFGLRVFPSGRRVYVCAYLRIRDDRGKFDHPARRVTFEPVTA